MTKRMYDAAYPPSSPPKWDAVAAYIGGNTPHVWTIAEWDAQPARWRLPIYVRSNPGSHSPHVDAALAVAWLLAHRVPHGSAIALDLETAVNASYVRAFDADLKAVGYVTVAYGSLSTIFHNPKPSGGYWVAHYTGKDHMEPGAVATQWASDRQLGKPWDASTVADSVPLWDTRPTPTPATTEEADMIERELKQGLDSKTEFLLPPGKVSMFVANADNTYSNANVKATGVVQIRVAIRKADGSWQSKTGTVGLAAADKSQPEFKLPLADTKSTFVSVTRVDGDGTEPVVVGAY